MSVARDSCIYAPRQVEDVSDARMIECRARNITKHVLREHVGALREFMSTVGKKDYSWTSGVLNKKHISVRDVLIMFGALLIPLQYLVAHLSKGLYSYETLARLSFDFDTEGPFVQYVKQVTVDDVVAVALAARVIGGEVFEDSDSIQAPQASNSLIVRHLYAVGTTPRAQVVRKIQVFESGDGGHPSYLLLHQYASVYGIPVDVVLAAVLVVARARIDMCHAKGSYVHRQHAVGCAKEYILEEVRLRNEDAGCGQE